jgi:pyruvate/2-oxoglutarate dehydrogenase complex dihydrolipoamide dehydrogenase (E3) component
MIRGADMIAEVGRLGSVAGTASVTSDWAPVARRIRAQATDNWDDRVAVERFEGKGGRFVRGEGRLVGPQRVEAGGEVFEAARAVVLATGTVPVIPPIPGLADVAYWTNRDAVRTETVPASLTVLGGGAIGLELAQVFARFGCRVTVVEAAPRLIAMEEPEAGDEIAELFRAEGIEVRVGRGVTAVAAAAGGIGVELEGGGSVTSERLLVATGRRADLGRLGLDTAGLDAGARFIGVDERMRAGDRLWAVGDVTGHGAFTHMAMYQAGIAAADILGAPHDPADYRATPRVTFTDPEIGAAGLTEAQARERGLRVRTGSTRTSTSARGWIHGPGNSGFIKLVEDADAGVLVGATSMGPVGGEVLSMLTLAIHARIPVSTLRSMIYAYPTFHRGVEDALRALARAADQAPAVA